jgi:hypothetical protein
MSNSYARNMLLFIGVCVVIGAAFFGYLAIYHRDALQKEATTYTPFTPNVPRYMPPQPVRKNLSEYPIGVSVWAERLASSTPPANAFHAYYFDRYATSTWRSVRPTTQESVDLKFFDYFDTTTGKETRYGSNNPNAIPGGRFEGYWVGTFSTSESKPLDLTIENPTHVAVFIDGRLVHSHSNDQLTQLAIPAGTHLMQVEYDGADYSNDISVELAAPHTIAKSSDYSAFLSQPNLRTWRVQVYESSAPDHRIQLSLAATSSAPTVLYLNSYAVVRWDFAQIPPHAIQAVIISSYENVATAVHVPAGTSVFYVSPDNALYSGNTFDPQSRPGFLKLYGASQAKLPGGNPSDIQ